MRITDLHIAKERQEDGSQALVCICTVADGEQIYCAVPWESESLWASDENGRHPDEIAAFLKLFAKAIERANEMPRPRLVIDQALKG